MRLTAARPDVPATAAVETPLVTTARLVAARAALAALHAEGVDARVGRRRAPRRTAYDVLMTGDAQGVAGSARSCCARTRLRGAFLAAGSVSRPDAPPHLEIAAASEEAAERLAADMLQIGVTPVLSVRRGRPVLAARSIDAVAALLSGIGAQRGRLRFEEGRVVREVRGQVNRRINSETANLHRTVGAGLRQVRAARSLQRDPERWRRLPPAVRDAATLRAAHPDETLARLAARAGISRAAMGGRLHRLVRLAGSAARAGDEMA